MIINCSNNKIISKHSVICDSLLCKFFGLMFSRREKDFGLIFKFSKETRASLHTLFVFYPIDVLFLDKHKRVVEIKENLKPFSFYLPKKKFYYVVELNNGAIRKSNIKISNRIKF